MDISVIQHKRCSTVKVVGRVDGSTSPQIEKTIKEVIESGVMNLVIDMTEVDFMSSAGWWVLIESQKECKKNNRGEVVLVNVKERIRASLDLVGMDTYFRIFDDLTEAVGSF